MLYVGAVVISYQLYLHFAGATEAINLATFWNECDCLRQSVASDKAGPQGRSDLLSLVICNSTNNLYLAVSSVTLLI